MGLRENPTKRCKSGDLQVSDAGFGTIFGLKKKKAVFGKAWSFEVLKSVWLCFGQSLGAVGLSFVREPQGGAVEHWSQLVLKV